MAKQEIGFEVTSYGDGNQAEVRAKALNQIFTDLVRESPAFAVKHSLQGNTLKIIYHCYEINLPSCIKQVQERSETVFRETLKHLKKEFKSKTKQALTLKEKKDQANYKTEKVSLNERYYFVAWRVYELE